MSTDISGPDGTETNEIDAAGVQTSEASLDGSETQSEAFTVDYVKSLRKESAGYRDRAKSAEERAETLAKRLHAELVRATGALVDPSELAYDAEHLEDGEKLSAAIETLLAAKPYLKPRKVAGDAGQGPRGNTETSPRSFADLLR